MFSFSTSRIFQKCQRQWYFKSHVANANAKKDPFRREAYLLSTLQSISAWRGSLVDQVITEQIVPALLRRSSLTVVGVINYARVLFDEQLEFARANRMREPGMTKTKAGRSYAALQYIEYGLGISDQEINNAWVDIEHALINLLDMGDLLQLLSQGIKLLPQRALVFSCNEIRSRMVPDLIVFYANQAPLIVDWKVHTFGSSDYRLQLASYAVALTRCEPHRDFSNSLARYQATDIRLLEVQLLTNQLRRYTLSEEDVDFVESYITRLDMTMNLAVEGRSNLTVFDLPPAQDSGTCDRCPFRSICWSKAE